MFPIIDRRRNWNWNSMTVNLVQEVEVVVHEFFDFVNTCCDNRIQVNFQLLPISKIEKFYDSARYRSYFS
jgi:hypothetical protein